MANATATYLCLRGYDGRIRLFWILPKASVFSRLFADQHELSLSLTMAHTARPALPKPWLMKASFHSFQPRSIAAWSV
jgi:hypothetical protein